MARPAPRRPVRGVGGEPSRRAGDRRAAPARAPASFDAELAPGLLGDQGFTVEIDAWDVPGGLILPDAAALQAYLIDRILPAAAAERVARGVIPPLEVTKRGALVWGRKPG
jgi:hypothetical protein